MTDIDTTTTLSLKVKEPTRLGLETILQQGFHVKTTVGITIKEFLANRQGLAPEYISKRISTIFLDSKPVDDIETAILRDGSTIALSGAMPGLVGAVMRQGSMYASFRSTITHTENGGDTTRKEGVIKIKLFNLLMKELGPRFLENGIYVEASSLLSHLENQTENFRQNIEEILLNRKPVESLNVLTKNVKDIILTASSRGASPGEELVLFSVKPGQTI